MENNFIGYIIAFVVGAAVPIFINWLERKDKRKQFELERKDKYKLVAVEKRLEAHQKALRIWSELIEVIHNRSGDRKNRIIKDAKDFWFNNSIYLETETRKKFTEVIGIVSGYSDMTEAYRSTNDPKEKARLKKEIEKNWNELFKLSSIIQKEVELEPINMKVSEVYKPY